MNANITFPLRLVYADWVPRPDPSPEENLLQDEKAAKLMEELAAIKAKSDADVA